MPAPRDGLVQTDGGDLREVLRRKRLLDVVVQYPPQAYVARPEQLRDLADRLATSRLPAWRCAPVANTTGRCRIREIIPPSCRHRPTEPIHPTQVTAGHWCR